MFRPKKYLLVGLALVVPAGHLHAQDDLVRRLAAVATIALDEYTLGVAEGVVTHADEYHEAQLFLSGAGVEAEGLRDERTRALTAAYLDTLSLGVGRLDDPASLTLVLGRFREGLQAVSGVVLDQYPDRAPSLLAGESLFQATCAGCHGLTGAGDGIDSPGMNPPPADLTDPAVLVGASPLGFYRLIGVGVAGTAMPGFETTHSVQDRWDLALYATSLRYAGNLTAGRRSLTQDCESCLVLFSGIEGTGPMDDDSLASLLSSRTGRSVTSNGFRDALAFARLAATAEELGQDRAMLFARVIGRVKAGVSAAVDAGIRGDVESAQRAVLVAYLEFERVEPLVKASSPRTGARIETRFAGLRDALVGGGEAGLGAASDSLYAALDRGVVVSVGGDRGTTMFGKSLLIILREGMEAMLIVGALAAFLVKSGAPERKAELGWGVLAAVAASLATAALFATVLSRAMASQEMIEGIVMLVAAGVLFWVSYWLISKIETRRWQAFVRNQVGKAVTSGSRVALPAVAFLAVYREGFETVLFYAALYSSAEGSTHGYLGVTLGLAVGSAILAVLYFVIQRYGVRIPLKPFFAVTSALLYLMAFSFVGQGITELQASGKVAITPVSWVPTVPALGIFPTVQTVVLQTLLAGAVVVAVAWIFWVSARQTGVTATPR